MSASIPLQIWFWQNIFSPHMAALTVELVRRGCEVTYVAEQTITQDRVVQGWGLPSLEGVTPKLITSVGVTSALVDSASADSVHICSGVRRNGLVAAAQRALSRRGLRQWVLMETVDDNGLLGILKRLEYRRVFMYRRHLLQGVLCIGARTPDWVSARGIHKNSVYPFAYFLPSAAPPLHTDETQPRTFRFVFVGQLIPRKQVDLLLDALSEISNVPFELWVAGVGPLETVLRELAQAKLGEKVRWFGQLALTEVPKLMAQCDCLVLPSLHDGWGAVVSEALMVGTPVICSDACGASAVVRASGFGGVFRRKNRSNLLHLLEQALRNGSIALADRRSLAGWAECLSGRAGADYLLRILEYSEGSSTSTRLPMPPWSDKSGLID